VHDIGLLGALTFVAFAAPRLRALARQNHYDVCHYYFGLPTGLLSCVPGAHRDRPYVISLRGSDVPGYSVNLRRYHRLMLPITRRIWRGAHRVLANSQDLRRLAQASVPGVRIDVILNGAATSTAVRSPPSPDAPVRVLTVSRLIERKGLDTLIKAIARSRNRTLHLDIAGEGPEGAALQRLTRACGLADRVRFLGFVDRIRLSSLYAHIDMFALVSRAESCSMAMLEAMAAGLPVIATRVGGNVELIQHERNGLLVEPGNVETLACALSTLAADPQQRLRFGACNRALVEQRYGWRSVAQRYESVFREALCSPADMAVEPDQELSLLQPPTGTDA
jgi:glycosyltransferase involved in cell wall biosynthesis